MVFVQEEDPVIHHTADNRLVNRSLDCDGCRREAQSLEEVDGIVEFLFEHIKVWLEARLSSIFGQECDAEILKSFRFRDDVSLEEEGPGLFCGGGMTSHGASLIHPLWVKRLGLEG